MDRRKKRTSINQYVMYIDSLEKDPIFRTGSVPRDMDVQYLSNKWKELSNKLNTCSNGPVLTPDEWRKRLNDWKNSTRCKYRRSISCEKDITMSPLELKALCLFGKTAVVVKSEPSIHLETDKGYNADEVSDGDQDADETVDPLHEAKPSTSAEDLQRDLDAAVRTATADDEEKSAHEGGNEENQMQINANFSTIVVESSAYNEGNDNHIDELISRVGEHSTELINGQIPLKRCRVPETIIYEVKKGPNPKTQLNDFNLLNGSENTPSKLLEVREIAHQLKRIADVKEEKLKFEIARFKFNNPGFNFSFNSS